MTSLRTKLAAAATVAVALMAPSVVPAHAATTVTASSAGSKPVGVSTNAWGTASDAPGRPVWTEVQLPDGTWSPSQRGTTTSSGGYTLPLTYGSGTAGTYSFRVGSSTGSGTVYSSAFTLTREAWISANSAGSTRTGVDANAWGTAHGLAGRTVWTEARRADGTWSRSQSSAAGSDGSYVIPLTYGQDVASTVTYRIGADGPHGRVYSPTFTLTRTGFKLDLSRWDSWIKIAECESGQRWNINTGNGYYGGLQFDYPTWHSVDGGDFANYPHQATREEQITVANRLYAKRGFQPWSCRRVL